MGSKGGTPVGPDRRGRSAGPVPTRSGDLGRKKRLETDDESSEKESSDKSSEESSKESMSSLPAKKPKSGSDGGNVKTPRKQDTGQTHAEAETSEERRRHDCTRKSGSLEQNGSGKEEIGDSTRVA